MNVRPIAAVVFVEFWGSKDQNLEQKHSQIMEVIHVVNVIWWEIKLKKNEDHIDDLDDDKTGVRVRVMVINATFNNVSAMSWQSAFLVEEAGMPWENHRSVAIHWTNVIS